MTSRPQWQNFVVPIISLGLAIVIMIVSLTAKSGVQIITLQLLYTLLDKSWLFLRSLVFLIISLAGMVVLSRNAQPQKKRMQPCQFVAVTLLGLVASLAIFYAFSCCDSPVVFFMGFPFSWLRGLTQAQHYLPLPAFQYLIMNYSKIDWGVDAFSLISNILFWYNISLLVIVSKKRQLLRAQQPEIQ